MCGCSVVESDDLCGSSAVLGIAVSVAEVTKGELVYEAKDMGSMGVYCAHTGAVGWSEGSDFSKLENRCYRVSQSGDWSIDGDAEAWGYESLSDKYSFFGYSPFDGDVDCVDSYISDGELVIYYTSPLISSDQPDLMLAVPHKDITAQVVSGVALNYHHALASVSFGVDSSFEKKIVGIEISGVVSEGSVQWDYDSNTPTWEFEEASGEIFSVVIEDYDLGDNTSMQISGESDYLMMIPQTLGSGVEVKLLLEEGEDMTLKIAAGTKWEAGSRYSYVVECDDGITDFIFTSKQVSNCYIINPIEGQPTVVQVPIEDRINDFWENYSGKESPKILSTSETSEFSVELVWEDFTTQADFGYEFLRDSDGKMAVSLSFSADCQEGNFVFWVYGESQLWSWHLWFTDYNPDAIAAANVDNIEIGVDRDYELDGQPGKVHRYVDANTSYSVWSDLYKDKFIMDRNIGERNSYVGGGGVGSVYYQFGRKDPFPGSFARYSSPTKSQPGARSSSTFTFIQSIWFANDMFITTSPVINWTSEEGSRSGAHIWFDKNIPSENYTIGKSIFDPSPLGWRIPVRDTWSYFNESGSSQSGCNSDQSIGIYNTYYFRNSMNNGAIDVSNNVSYVWSANPLGEEFGYCLYSTSTTVTAPATMYITDGLPIRAVQE